MSDIFYADLFSGTGGFSKGFSSYDNNYKLAFAVDILKIAAQTTKANHSDAFVVADDIYNVKPSAVCDELRKNGVPHLDLIIGGPPCQGFSSIRPFRSKNDEDPRNSLFEEFAKYINYFHPKVFVLENVVGIITHDNGRTIERMQELFYQIGYTTDWRILNTANYGIPQKRERFILIGVGKGGKVEFPAPTHSFGGKTIGSRKKDRLIKLSPDENASIAAALSVMDAISDLPSIGSGEIADHYCDSHNEYQRCRRKGANLLTLHEATRHSPKMLEIISHAGASINCIPKQLITSGFSTCYSRLEPSEPANTITVNFVHPASNKCIHPYQDRALTPREGARLQGFDDDFIFCGNRAQIVKQIGNAVPPLLGRAIASVITDKLS